MGDQWAKPTDKVTVRVFLPGPQPEDKIWAFGHGPLNGKVSIVSNQEVGFSAQDLPVKKFFEVRVLFPKLEGAINAAPGNSSLAIVVWG